MTKHIDDFKRQAKVNRLMEKAIVPGLLVVALLGGLLIWLAHRPSEPVYLFTQNSCRVYVVSHANRDSTEFLCRCHDASDVGTPAAGRPRTARLSRLLL